MLLSKRFGAHYYTSVYGDYFQHNPRRKLDFYRGLLLRHLMPSPSPKVLDLGCAYGLFLAGLPETFQKFGIDASYDAVSAAASRAPGAHFIAADCETPPIAARFDAIVAFDVLEHLRFPDATFEFVHRSLIPGGVFVFVVPAYDGPLGPIIRRLDRDPTHVHKRSRQWWLDQAGRRFETVFWTGILRYLVAPRFYLHMTGSALRQFAPAVAVVTRKQG